MGPPGLISIPGRGTARGTAGGREWGAICCAPYSGLDLVDQAAPPLDRRHWRPVSSRPPEEGTSDF